jgi:hypothetical protein
MAVRELKDQMKSNRFQTRRLVGASIRGDPLQFPSAGLLFSCEELISRIPGLATNLVVEIRKDESV